VWNTPSAIFRLKTLACVFIKISTYNFTYSRLLVLFS
jgi:hypothetical protein